MPASVNPVEAFLNSLQHPLIAGVDLSLDRVLRLLAMLGSPHKKLPPVVHVAGTNGKGSMLATLHAMLEAADYRVHRYTSPHLIEFRERILLQGKQVENSYLQHLSQHLAGVMVNNPVTFFEATTAMAFIAFSEKPADILLLETGMGGRLDATNVVEKPLLTVITPISYDHKEYLGNDLTAIAAEKAAIMKKDVPCVVGRQVPDVLAVLEAQAENLGVELYRFGQAFDIENHDGKVMYRSSKRHIELTPALLGRFQYDNAATAVACLDVMDTMSVNDDQLAMGMANTQWDARLQPLKQHRYCQYLSEGISLYLDGGHNQEGGRVLGEWLAEQSDQEIYLVFGMLKDKEPKEFLRPMVDHVTALYAVDIPGEEAGRPAAQLQTQAQAVGIESQTATSVENALQSIAQRAKTPAIVCICGSLYLAGKVLAADK